MNAVTTCKFIPDGVGSVRWNLRATPPRLAAHLGAIVVLCITFLALYSNPASAQTVACGTTSTPTNTTRFLVDAGAKTCVIADASNCTTPATTGSMCARASINTVSINLIAFVRNSGGNSSSALSDFTTCDITGGLNPGTNCVRSVNPPGNGQSTFGSGSATFANTLGTETVTLNLTFTAAVPSSVAFTVATVTFSALPVTPPTGPTESDNLKSQQQSLSNLVVNFQMNNVANGVFGHLGQSFANGGSGVQVNAAGFSASVSGIANFVNRNKQDRLKRQLADFPRDENGDKVTVIPAASTTATRSKWNAWIKGNWSYYDGKGSSFDGHTVDVLVGFDYKVDDTMVIGFLGGYGKTNFDTLTNGTKGSFKADGLTVGPYIGMKLSEHIQFDAMVAYTSSDYDNRSGATKGSFDAHRVTAAAQLTGTWNVNDFFVNPGIRIVYARENQDAYTDSAAVNQSRLIVKAGRVSVGPKVGYMHRSEEGYTMKPWLALKGEYDFSNQGTAANSGLPDLSNTLSARVTAGVDATTTSGVTISLQADISGLGSDQYTGYGGTARVDVPF